MNNGFTRRQRAEIRNEVKLGIMDASKDLMKQVRGECMTRAECLSIHQGRYTPEAVEGQNGNLRKEKLKFWGAITGLILSLTTLTTIIGSVLVVKYIGG